MSHNRESTWDEFLTIAAASGFNFLLERGRKGRVPGSGVGAVGK